MKPSPIRELKQSVTRERIVDAALGLFTEVGYRETSIDDIANEAAIGRRTFFRYFPSKEAVFFADTASLHSLAIRNIEQRPASEPPLKSLLDVFGDLCDRPIEKTRNEKIAYLVATDPEILGIVHKTDVYGFEELLLDCLRPRTRTTMTDEELRVVISTAVACLGSAWRVQLMHPEISLRGHFDAMVRACAANWGGIDPPKAKRSTLAKKKKPEVRSKRTG